MLIMCTDFQPYMSNQTIEKFVVVVLVVGAGWWSNANLVFCFGQTFELKTKALNLDQAEQ